MFEVWALVVSAVGEELVSMLETWSESSRLVPQSGSSAWDLALSLSSPRTRPSLCSSIRAVRHAPAHPSTLPILLLSPHPRREVSKAAANIVRQSGAGVLGMVLRGWEQKCLLVYVLLTGLSFGCSSPSCLQEYV